MKILDLNKIWAYSITATMAFFEPLWVLMLWFLIFIGFDLFTGICAAYVEGDIITSNKMRKTVGKFTSYALAIVLLHGIDVYMLPFDALYMARIGATIICGIELHSIFENCYRVTGNRVFLVLTQFTLKKIQEKTGVSEDELNKCAKKAVRKGKAHERKHK